MDKNSTSSRIDFEGAAQAHRDFKFTVTGGSVTGIQAVAGTKTLDLPIPTGATFTVGTDAITETLTGKTDTTVIQFAADKAAPGLFDIASITHTITTPTTTAPDGSAVGFSFTLTGGAVTGEQHVETEHGKTHTETVQISPASAFTTGTGTVTESLVYGNQVTTLNFVQPTGSTLYAVSSVTTQFIDPGAATTALNVNPYDRLEFTIDGTGKVTQVQSVDHSGGLHTVTPNADVTFTQLAPGYVEEVINHGGHSRFEVFFAGQNSNGISTEIAHGDGSTVDLAGLQAQVAQLPTSLGWII